MNDRVEFLGAAFDPVGAGEAEAWLAARDAASPYGYVVTPNVDHLVRLAQGASELHDIYRDADLCLCDSRVLTLLARLCGIELRTAPGSDLVATLFDRVLRAGDRVCVIGGSAEVADRLRARYPAIEVVHYSPPMGLRYNTAARLLAARFAVEAGARVILFAVGSPQQEMLARELAAMPGARGTGLCIGASVEFLTGDQVRAPRLVQRLSLEWAWRLASDPRRMAERYLVRGPAILPMVWRWRRARARAHRP